MLLVVTEEQPPQVYAPWVDDVPFPYALALLLTQGDDWRLTLSAPQAPMPVSDWPHALGLLRTLLSNQTTCQHAWKNRVWTWQRNR